MQKELYPSEEAEALTGHWLLKCSDALLYAYCMSFDVQPMEDETCTNFVLLTGSALEDDVAELEIDLCLTRGRKVIVKLSPLGTTTFSADQVYVTGHTATLQMSSHNNCASCSSRSFEEVIRGFFFAQFDLYF